MIKTNKDLIFTVTVILWLSSNVIGFFIDGNFGTTISNFICIGLFGTMTVIKLKYKKFGLWLEKPILKSL